MQDMYKHIDYYRINISILSTSYSVFLSPSAEKSRLFSTAQCFSFIYYSFFVIFVGNIWKYFDTIESQHIHNMKQLCSQGFHQICFRVIESMLRSISMRPYKIAYFRTVLPFGIAFRNPAWKWTPIFVNSPRQPNVNTVYESLKCLWNLIRNLKTGEKKHLHRFSRGIL